MNHDERIRKRTKPHIFNLLYIFTQNEYDNSDLEPLMHPESHNNMRFKLE